MKKTVVTIVLSALCIFYCVVHPLPYMAVDAVKEVNEGNSEITSDVYEEDREDVETVYDNNAGLDFKGFVDSLLEAVSVREHAARELEVVEENEEKVKSRGFGEAFSETGTNDYAENDTFNNEQTNGETMKNVMDQCLTLANLEWAILGKYENYVSKENESSSIGLSSQAGKEKAMDDYLHGLKKQLNADTSDEKIFWAEWETGFQIRAGAVAEMIDLLCPELLSDEKFPEGFRSAMRAYTGFAAQEYSAENYLIQAILAYHGFIEPDGVDGNAGIKTYAELKDYLSSKEGIYCWVISENLIRNLINKKIITEDIFDSAVELITENGKIEKMPIDEREKLRFDYYSRMDYHDGNNQ